MHRYGRREWAVAAGAVAAFALSALDLHQHYDGAPGVALAFALARAATIVLAWTNPVTALVASTVLELVNALVSTPVSDNESWPWPFTAIACHVVVLVLLGVRYRGRVDPRVVLGAAWLGTQLVGVVAVLARSDQGGVTDLLPPAVLSAAAVVIADLVRSRAGTRAALVRQERISADEQAARLRSEERARIARELHDVVAHHLSVVVVRADSATRRLPALPDDTAAEVAAEFAAIADDARSSLDQMRRVLRLLRDESTPPEAAPLPRADDIDDLVAGARDAGAAVTFTGRAPADAELAASAGLVAYRVVQEAISNAMQHAPGAPITVAVDRTAGDLVVTIANPAAGEPGPDGFGLRGMRERVDGVGGRLDVRTVGARFVVSASLPRRTPARTNG